MFYNQLTYIAPTGDCWLLAAIASLTLKKEALARVVPPDQDFDHRYAGIFHFQVRSSADWLKLMMVIGWQTFERSFTEVPTQQRMSWDF